MELKVGTIVAYPPHGVGRVAKREKRVVLGVEEDVVVVELGNELSVTLPISRAEEQLRPPATEADLKKVQKALREEGVVSDEIWSKRVQQAQEKLRSGERRPARSRRARAGRRSPRTGQDVERHPDQAVDERARAAPQGTRAPFGRDRRDARPRARGGRGLDRRAARRGEVAQILRRGA